MRLRFPLLVLPVLGGTCALAVGACSDDGGGGGGSTSDAGTTTLEAGATFDATPGSNDAAVDTDAGADAGRDRVVFATSEQYIVYFLGGLSGADAKCNAAATAADAGKTFQAWLSTSTTSPAARFAKDGRFVDPTGALVASSWSELTSGTLAHGIERDAKGEALAPRSVWTATKTDGTPATTGGTCGDFANPNSPDKPQLGTTGLTTAAWTAAGPALEGGCNTSASLLCFEL